MKYSILFTFFVHCDVPWCARGAATYVADQLTNFNIHYVDDNLALFSSHDAGMFLVDKNSVNDCIKFSLEEIKHNC